MSRRHDIKADPSARVVNALSFDIEDWFHLVDVPAVSNPDTWFSLRSIVEERTDEILGICDEFSVVATFFIVGWIAERHPHLVRRIADAGHELGSHSFWHRKVFKHSPESFRADLRRSIDVIEDTSGQRVSSFRAPSFSITPGTEWAFEVIVDEGLDYDASLFPANRQHGGYPCPQHPHVLEAPSGRLLPEIPMTLLKVGSGRIGFSGGGYFRLLPSRLIHRGFQMHNEEGRPVVVYLHPRDFAPDSPRVPMRPDRFFRTYVGLSTTSRKLRMLLSTYEFASCGEVVNTYLSGA